ncbi:MAG: polysaccharide deacetylase family protein [Spirochaetaceae bacterium]|jgi:peptidoglycan/xylan/chitin deacetylase (PgdA/CDA1 family)|nr:polysaccharide deacetylase family protein [Spirochaetaceae bacterium]
MFRMFNLLILLLFFIIPISLWCEVLFLPKTSNPFVLNSSGGTFSIISETEKWPMALEISTDGKGANVQLSAINLPSFSLENKNLIIWVKVDNVQNLNEFWLFSASDREFSNRIVYKISDDKTQLVNNRWLKVSLPLSAGHSWGIPVLSDLRAFQIWINDNGLLPVSIKVGPIYTEDSDSNGGRLIFTFDDGRVSNITAAKVLKDFGYSATAYIIPNTLNTEGFLSESQVDSLMHEYKWTIGAHYNERLDNKTEAELREIFDNNSSLFKKWGNENPDFSYPNGAFNNLMLDIIPEYFNSGRTIVEYPETIPPGDSYRIRSLNVIPGFSMENLKRRLEEAVKNKELLVLIFHKIKEVSSFETEITKDELYSICRAVQESGIQVGNLSSLSAYWPNAQIPLSIWNSSALFQKKVQNVEIIEQKTSEILTVPKLKLQPEIAISFGLDWKMVLGKRISDGPGSVPATGLIPLNSGTEGDWQFYNQIDEIALNIDLAITESTIVSTSFGLEDANFTDFSAGALEGSLFSLKSLYVKQKIGSYYTLQPGYFTPDPLLKWLQVTKSAGIEPAFGQEMAPRSLWINNIFSFSQNLGFQFSFSPDFIGKTQGNNRVLTYQQDLGVPNLFASLWYISPKFETEIASSVNGDALKIAFATQMKFPIKIGQIFWSTGIKFSSSEAFTTFPLWDYQDVLSFSTGLASIFPVGSFTFTSGLAYKLVIPLTGTAGHQGGLDFSISWKKLEWFIVLTCYDIPGLFWSENTGLETGFIFKLPGLELMSGYTMAGFNSISGLYNNKIWNEGGVDGVFFRIRTKL